VPALASQQVLVPAAAGLNIPHTNQRLWAHPQLPGGRSPPPWFLGGFGAVFVKIV
jgi:hypothetical protein